MSKEQQILTFKILQRENQVTILYTMYLLTDIISKSMLYGEKKSIKVTIANKIVSNNNTFIRRMTCNVSSQPK